MGTKLDLFKQRCLDHGQEITIAPWSAWPTGSYVDDYGGGPDPDNVNYPATQPSPAYGTSVTLDAFVQPVPTGKEILRAPWGEDVQARYTVYIPGDQAITVRDKITVSSVDYWIARIEDWIVDDETVYHAAFVTESVPR